MGELSPDVVDFLRRCVRSSDELDLLLLLRQSERQWSAVELGAELGRPAASVAEDLEDLYNHSLLAASSGQYRYSPDTPDLEPAIERLSEQYRHNRRTVNEICAGAKERSS
jgi:DNA-binding IclR family transcriptional regulator